MGYGGSLKEAASVVGKSGDAGIDDKIVLVDGDKPAELMIEHDLGMSSVQVYEIKRIDSDYFEGE
jgi:restriction system protein